MKTMGFINSHKENENRIALLPCHMNELGKEAAYMFFERGYASKLGIPDQEYEKMGASISTREEILQKCDIICDLKAGDAEYLGELREGTTIFGWVHPHVDPDMKKLLLDRKLRVYAWEEMLENSTQIFYRNSILAGEASVLHGCLSYGILMEGKRAAILGRGNTAMGAYKMLVSNAALTTVYGRRQEQQFRKEMEQFDIIVNAVLWDPERRDHILFREDLKKLKKDALLIDVSCDEHGAIETSHPTTTDNPIYREEGVAHYCLDHSPSLFYRSASEFISEKVSFFIKPLVWEREDRMLEGSRVIDGGKMILKESCR